MDAPETGSGCRPKRLLRLGREEARAETILNVLISGVMKILNNGSVFFLISGVCFKSVLIISNKIRFFFVMLGKC